MPKPSNGAQRGTQRPKRRPKRIGQQPRPAPASGEIEQGQQPAPGEYRPPEAAPGAPPAEISTIGRPRLDLSERDIEQAEALAGYGLTEPAIAHVLGVSPSTLSRRRDEDPRVSTALERGRAIARAKVGQALFVLATGATVAIPRKASGEEPRDRDGYLIDAQGRRIMDQAYTRLPELGAIVWWEKTRGGMREIVRFEQMESPQPEQQMSDDEIAAELNGILSIAAERERRLRLSSGGQQG